MLSVVDIKLLGLKDYTTYEQATIDYLIPQKLAFSARRGRSASALPYLILDLNFESISKFSSFSANALIDGGGA